MYLWSAHSGEYGWTRYVYHSCSWPDNKGKIVWLLLLFLIFSALVANPKKKPLLYTVANPARALLNREKKKKKKSGSASPPRARAARSEKKQNK